MNKDTNAIFETYVKTSSKQEIIQEGLFDRIATRGAQAMGAVKGLGQQIKGKAQELTGQAIGKVGGAVGKVGGALGSSTAKQVDTTAKQIGKEISKAGKKTITTGKMVGDVAKYTTAIQRTVANTVNDLKKLNMPVKDEAALTQALTAAIQAQLTNVTPSGQLRVGGKLGAKVV